MSVNEPFPYDVGDLLWKFYSSTKDELTTYCCSFAENVFLWILSYFLICGFLYVWTLKRNWSCSKIEGVKRALFVIAHPDDECMFFGPTIVHFLRRGIDVHLLCLSQGDHEGRGRERRGELWRACAALGVRPARITLLHDPALVDGPHHWPSAPLAERTLRLAEALDADALVTFDRDGVSGHPNHRSIFHAVGRLCLERRLPPNCRLFTLDSVNLLRKYWGYLDLPLSFLLASNRFVLPLQERKVVVNAMKEHKSQLVWFRHLYLFFSRFIVINTLKEVTVLDLELELDLED